ncbi:hypothetical protein AB0H36_30725 [Kribbella sp. NPDC050820]|uniref:hypothetical protein n=1 Tax=Kribbella sp. NPDC050820 TaxID=3155408 RepID=UPI0033DD48ED
MKHRLVTGAVILGVLIFAVPGVWAFGWPRSFYDNVATYPPYNLHFVHNIGAFQLGIAAALAGALVWGDALTVALLGGAVGCGFHAISDFLDDDLGGSAGAPWVLAVFTTLLAAAFAARVSVLGRHAGEGGRPQ